MPEEFQPVAGPVVAVQLAAYAAGFSGLIASVSLLASALGPIIVLVVMLVALVFTLMIIHSVLPALWISWTERYAIDRGHVRIQRSGWMGGIVSDDIPVWKISEVRVVMPLLLRFVLVGRVEIITDRGMMHTLQNVRNPEVVAERIRLYPSCQSSIKTA